MRSPSRLPCCLDPVAPKAHRRRSAARRSDTRLRARRGSGKGWRGSGERCVHSAAALEEAAVAMGLSWRICGWVWGCAMVIAPAVRQQSLIEGLMSCEDCEVVGGF
jgi:hypothetical protein